MKRREFLRGALITGVSVPLFSCTQVSPTYGESVAVSGVTHDGLNEFSLRLSRYPGRRTGSLWASAYAAYAAGAYELGLGKYAEATPVKDDRAVFTVEGDATARFERSGLDSTFLGKASASVSAHASYHPPVGLGEHPISIEAEFQAWHAPVYPRAGRLEMMGAISATVKTPSGAEKIEGVGTWHEQVGERPQFAPAFTYFKVMGDGIGVLASIRHDTGIAWGYALVNDMTVGVTSFQIDGEQETREFQIHLDDGQSIGGKVERFRQHSVPVEGQRRPGTTVRVSSNIGPLIGWLNDWHPEEA